MQWKVTTPEENVDERILEVIVTLLVCHEFFNVRRDCPLAVGLHINLSRCGITSALKVLFVLNVHMDSGRRLQGAENKLAFIVKFDTETECESSLCLSSIGCLGSRIDIVGEEILGVGIEIRHVHANPPNQVMVIKHTIIVIKHPKKELRTWMKHMQLEGPLTPRHPPRRERIVDDISLTDTIFIYNRDESIGFVAQESSGIKLRKSITANDFQIKLAEISRSHVDPML
mmetsp:Transcript_32405/g.71158  ORF Transcript_32405/g.71158 Transcript_32405/m.71158 type:complete len:229 (+) Transcript_32405:2471-3157(+)